jgi:DNA-binding NtrC family response regulator
VRTTVEARGDEPGTKGRVLLSFYGPEGASAATLGEGESLVVGRATLADVCIDDERMSRQHARLSCEQGVVWVEDLKSRNGTRVNGAMITEKCAVEPGGEATVGRTTVCVHQGRDADTAREGLVPHRETMGALAREIVRARFQRRHVALLLVRAGEGAEGTMGRWCPGLRRALRPFDTVGIYLPGVVAAVLPETSLDEAERLAGALLHPKEGDALPVVFGVAAFPETAGSADALLEGARGALARTGVRRPIQAAARGGEATGAEGDAAAAPAGVAAAGKGAKGGAAAGAVVASRTMREVFDLVERVAEALVPVLIIGETGTGKELVARAVHDGGPRKAGPWRSINCGAMAPTLLEDKLFGHERGAFTGADRRAAGLFEETSGGTLFLDEVGELTAAAQATLLRVLETRCVQRLGAHDDIKVDVRVVAATNRDLDAMVEAGTFRRDLLHRLNTVTIRVPPLRDRPEEIAPLARVFLGQSVEGRRRGVTTLAADAIALLERQPWPGNVRQLRNEVERAALLAEGDSVTAADLSAQLRARPLEALDLRERVKRCETEVIMEALRRAGGSQTAATKLLRISRRTLTTKMKELDIRSKILAE